MHNMHRVHVCSDSPLLQSFDFESMRLVKSVQFVHLIRETYLLSQALHAQDMASRNMDM